MSEDMNEHTPLPWKVYRASNEAGSLLGVGSAETGVGVTDARGGIWQWEDAEGIANANLIITAVNERPTLLARVRELEEACEHAEAVMSIVEPRSNKAEYLECVAKLRAAIADR